MDSIRGRGGGGSNSKDSDINSESGDYHQYSSNHHHPYYQYFSGASLKITLLFVVVSMSSLLLNLSAYSGEFYQMSYSFSDPKHYSRGNLYSSSSSDNHASLQHNALSLFRQFITQNLLPQGKEENDLEKTLREAVMKDKKTVIITTLNAAWTEPNSIFDLFLESFRVGNGTQKLLKHVVVGAFDTKAYSRCMEKHLHCYAMRTDGVDFSGYASFKSDDYLKMIWGRIDFLRSVLELGYDFVFTDADVMWLRDPFPRFYPDGDFQISCDHYWYNYTDLNNTPNGGFKYVRTNNRSIQFYKYWHRGKDYFPGKHDQNVLDLIKFSPYIREIGLEIRFLGTLYYSGFCEPSRDLDMVITMHANCCTGLENKTHDIKMVIDDWNKYMALPNSVRRNLSMRYWTAPKLCGYFN